MSPEQSLTLDKQDRDDFSTLTAQESHTIEGQILKMKMIGEIIDRRFEVKREAVKRQLSVGSDLDDDALDKAVDASFQKIHVTSRDIGDGRFNLIVEKGDDAESDDLDESLFRMMIPAHVDTVDSDAPTILETKNDQITGQGVFDMGAAVLNNIALAVDTQVPKGMKVYFVFTADEEMHSSGAKNITEWSIFPSINCVLSSEIGPVKTPLPTENGRMRIITARTGRLKLLAKVKLDPGSQGHGAEDHLPSAGGALRKLQNLIYERFDEGYVSTEGNKNESPQKRSHDLLPMEKIEDGDYFARKSRKRMGYMNTNEARWEFSIRMVPPSTTAEYLQHFERWTRGIDKREDWRQRGVIVTMEQNKLLPKAQPSDAPEFLASYSPYEMPADHPFVFITSNVLRRLSGVAPEIIGAKSVADECVYAETMLGQRHSFADLNKGIVTIPINGDGAHTPEEWVSQTSILQVRRAILALIEDEDGFRSLLRKGV